MQLRSAAEGMQLRSAAEEMQLSAGVESHLVCAEEYELAPRSIFVLNRPAAVTPPHHLLRLEA